MHSVAPAEWNSLNQFSCLLGQRCSQHFSHLTQVNPWHVLTLQRCHFGSHVGKWPSVSRQTPLHGSDAAGPLFLFCSACCWVSLLGLPCFCTVVWLCLHRHSATGAFKLASWRGFSACPYIPWDQPCVDNGKINEVKGGSQRRFLDLILFLYSWSKESGRSAPPMCLLYTSITCEHGMETCVFPFPDQCFASPAGLLPTKVDRR